MRMGSRDVSPVVVDRGGVITEVNHSALSSSRHVFSSRSGWAAVHAAKGPRRARLSSQTTGIDRRSGVCHATHARVLNYAI